MSSRLEDLKARIESREARMGVIGLGYVGLPLSVEFARAGFYVTGFDLDAEKVGALNEGNSYIEDVPSEDLQSVLSEGRLTATTDFSDLARLDVINICVPTPLTNSKDPDLSHMTGAMEEIRRRMRSGQLVILGSTTYPGTTHELFVPVLEQSGLKVGEDFSLAFAPERIDPGNKTYRVRNVPKVVGGETAICTDLACAVYDTIFDEVVPVTNSQSAEMVKILENTFRAINIGLANEVALMCERLGLDVWEIIDAAATKPYGYMKFVPGPGLGGHCIPVDPSYLSWKMKTLNFNARFIELAAEINTHMPDHVATRAGDLLNEDRLAVNGAHILILGVAYKKNVGDMRESPSIDIIGLLADKGAEITYHDPHVRECHIGGVNYKNVDLTPEVLAGADLVIVLTDHEAVDYQQVADHAPRVFDTRNAMKGTTGAGEKITKL
jgi:UDP-N-acetyl-D-glucosamine dehydrogenase